jgi:hypothetical protein
MPARDIMPWKSPLGGTYEVRWGAMTAGEDFEIGEPIGLVDAGTLTEPPQDTTEVLHADFDAGHCVGIACFGPGAGNINPMTGVAFATGDMIAYWPIDQGTLFITSNFHSDAGAAAVVPALTDVGESYELDYATAAAPIGWGLDQTANATVTELGCKVVEVLDTNYNPTYHPLWNGTGVYLVFEITSESRGA